MIFGDIRQFGRAMPGAAARVQHAPPAGQARSEGVSGRVFVQ
jgi:hypothetical protein